jgi:hypothetical protein
VPHWIAAFSYGHGGLGVVLATLIALPAVRGSRVRPRQALAMLRPLLALICASVAVELVLTGWYAITPAYIDHIEASVASDAHYFLAGLPLYPPFNSYTFHGLLYGPLLAEVNSLGSVVFNSALASKVIGWLAAWIAIATLLTSAGRAGLGLRSFVGCGYALCLLVSLGGDVTIGRSEPLLLLCTAIALAIAVHWPSLSGLMLLGLLCGAAADLKIHGPVYLLAPVYLWIARQPTDHLRKHWLAMLACLAGAAIIGVALPFAPSNVSAAGYLSYLQLALRHGLDLDMFRRNCVFLLGMWAPILLFLRPVAGATGAPPALRGFAWTLLGAECVVVVVASKPGAGMHHLLPFLTLHAYLLQSLYIEQRASSPGASRSVDTRATLALAATILGMLWPTAQSYSRLLEFELRWPEHVRQRDELLRFTAQFPHGMIGVAGEASYVLANFRPWITQQGTPQTDYGAFMDLRLSGLGDEPLRLALDLCRMPFVYMPRPGMPFTLMSRYGGALFSDALRDEFTQRYSLVAVGNYFDVFACHQNTASADGHSDLPRR